MTNKLKHSLRNWWFYSACTFIISYIFVDSLMLIPISLLIGFLFSFLNDIITELRKLNGERFPHLDDTCEIDLFDKDDDMFRICIMIDRNDVKQEATERVFLQLLNNSGIDWKYFIPDHTMMTKVDPDRFRPTAIAVDKADAEKLSEIYEEVYKHKL